MLPSVRQIYPNNFIYQQDYCPVHTAHVVTQWLRNNIETLPSPAKSPDLNWIKNVWGRMAKEMLKLNVRPRTADDLWEIVENTWESLSDDEIYAQALVH
jgi:hypothetical protein